MQLYQTYKLVVALGVNVVDGVWCSQPSMFRVYPR
jgi:hypothetical protein